MVREIQNQAELDQIISEAGDKVIVLDFMATWCGPCKMVAPKFLEFSVKYTNMVCLKVDSDEAEELVEKYNIQAMPTFVFVKQNNEVHRMMGADVKKLEECFVKFN